MGVGEVGAEESDAVAATQFGGVGGAVGGAGELCGEGEDAGAVGAGDADGAGDLDGVVFEGDGFGFECASDSYCGLGGGGGFGFGEDDGEFFAAVAGGEIDRAAGGLKDPGDAAEDFIAGGVPQVSLTFLK